MQNNLVTLVETNGFTSAEFRADSITEFVKVLSKIDKVNGKCMFDFEIFECELLMKRKLVSKKRIRQKVVMFLVFGLGFGLAGI